MTKLEPVPLSEQSAEDREQAKRRWDTPCRSQGAQGTMPTALNTCHCFLVP